MSLQRVYETKHDQKSNRKSSAPRKTTTTNLTPAQQLVCDEVAELLFNGGHENDVKGLLWAVLSPAIRRGHTRPGKTADEIEKSVEAILRHAVPKYRAALADGWRKYEREPRSKPEAKTATDRIRANVAERLWHQFTEFMIDAKPEEMYIMLDLLLTHESGQRGRICLTHDLPIVLAINDTMGSLRACVQVDEDHLETVEQYVQSLEVLAVGGPPQ